MKSKVVGLDLGTKTLGVAISDSFGMMAHNYDVFKFKSGDYPKAINYVANLVKSKNISKIVIGFPKQMDNSLGKRAKETMKFAKRMEEKLDIEVILVDERMTTIMASNVLSAGNVKEKNKKKYVDKIAAQIILQTYLDKEEKKYE
ncbi:MAG: Holliday junction resolvase RuvX [Bacilli bacterium]